MIIYKKKLKDILVGFGMSVIFFFSSFVVVMEARLLLLGISFGIFVVSLLDICLLGVEK